MLDRVTAILASAGQPSSSIRPTALYDEGWMLRLVLDYLAEPERAPADHPFRFLDGAHWYSEAQLFSAFLSRFRQPPDQLAEGWTNADGVVGHFIDPNRPRPGEPNQTRTGEFRLDPQARQFVVIEAKMFSGLSPRVTRCAGYDQAARNVACMAAVLSRANIRTGNMERLAFFVVAPLSQIEKGIFGQRVTKESIRQRVESRVNAYAGELDNWFHDWFMPTLNALHDVELLSWDEVLQNLPDGYRQFYLQCLHYNGVPADSQ